MFSVELPVIRPKKQGHWTLLRKCPTWILRVVGSYIKKVSNMDLKGYRLIHLLPVA